MPLHRALVEAGHVLTLVGRASAVRAVPAGLYDGVVSAEDHRNEPSRTIAPLVPVDIEHELAVVEQHFAGSAALTSAASVAPELHTADLLVCDELDFGAMAAAQRAGVPVVVVAVIASGALVRPGRLAAPLDRLRDELGLAELIRLHGDLFVVPFAPPMRDPLFPAPADTVWMRPAIGAAPRPDGSIVATLGTEFNTESGDLFDRILSALGSVDAPSVLAVGRDLDPARFSARREHVRVEQFVDLDALAARASVVVHHGGSGLFLSSVLGGAPQVVLPMGADQPFTARRVEGLGVGRALDAETASADDIAGAVASARADRALRTRTGALRLMTTRLPEPADVVDRIETALGSGRLR
ncbi:nucleotide disphospho-sugar-binding domain-containing protein [Curtobacterium sp. PhB115]|uniref:glycosyltransferase n=1 Tax=Curtobacterium sp. PhB115 TaxID=2485173 RepID=UPI0011CE7EF2|nr:nucleotide disphospho-sugar-binding domain-containing protein [Curtobacterium sp. PhB115]